MFVRNRNKKDEYIVLLSTDCNLSASEIVRRYGNRWPIECCFKACKSLLKLGKEFHGVSYDLTVSSTALVFTHFDELVNEAIQLKRDVLSRAVAQIILILEMEGLVPPGVS